VAQALNACRYLRSLGAKQIYFKICSTFDSTPAGNIGPVIEALMDELHCGFSIVNPAFPENGRTVLNGHLFVGAALLSESGMRHHPLTPMTEANLVRFLQLQMDHRKVGLIDHKTVAAGPDEMRKRVEDLKAQGVSVAITDSICNQDLLKLGEAFSDAQLVTAASGLALALPVHWGFAPSPAAVRLPAPRGRKAIVCGSCSSATQAQVEHFLQAGGSAYKLEASQLVCGPMIEIERALVWAEDSWLCDPVQPVLVYSTAEAAQVKSTQDELGVHRAGVLFESALSATARAMVQRGVGQLIVAGGETAGACAQALNIHQMQIGPQIDPGVPWCYASSVAGTATGLHLALKSGNFGSTDFFSKAFAMLK
jgi:uncharacterized protein YgbK (DUF1537 family)